MRRRKDEPTALMRLDHARQAIANIGLCIAGKENADDLAADKLSQWATERQLAILLEAVWRLPDAIYHDYGGRERKEVLPPNVRNSLQQVANDLRHEYHRITAADVWQSVTKNVPVIERYVADTALRLPRDLPPRKE